MRWTWMLALALVVLALLSGRIRAQQWEQRNEVSYLRGPYNFAFYHRENRAYRIGAAIHFAHGKQHDTLQLTPLDQHEEVDAQTEAEFQDFTRKLKARVEPPMELYAPLTAQFAWRVYRVIDWTHMHHEQTYDILAEKSIPWDQKKHWTDRSVDYYLHKNDVGFSCAPLDVTMRRVASMGKPYFTYFRNYYPKSNNFFYAAHWWHPVIYQAQMLGGNGPDQDRLVKETDQVFFDQVLNGPPLRMLLAREIMPLYARMSPESSNIFDNLHMFHGIVYDIMAYEGWNLEQKRAELYRVIEAMRYRPGDEKLARKFKLPHGSDIDPRKYEPWMKTVDGEMTRIMMEMHEEMMPHMMPDGKMMGDDMKKKMTAQLRLKLTPGMQDGEIPGSWHDAMMKLMPDMKMDPQSMQPGQSSQMMVDAMLKGWQDKYGSLPDVEALSMEREPVQK